MSTSNIDEKVQVVSKVPATTEKLPDRKETVESARAELATKTQELRPRLKPDELKSLYLAGRISMNQLAYELRVYNSNTADWIMRESKRNAAQTIDYRAAPEAKTGTQAGSASNDETNDSAQPVSSRDANKQAREKSDPEAKRKAEREAERLKKNEDHDRIVQINIITEQQSEQKKSELLGVLRREQEEENREESREEEQEREARSEVKNKTRQKLRERVQRSISKERKEEMEKGPSGASKASR